MSPDEGSWKADARNEVRVDCCVLTVPAYTPSTSRVFFFFLLFPSEWGAFAEVGEEYPQGTDGPWEAG